MASAYRSWRGSLLAVSLALGASAALLFLLQRTAGSQEDPVTKGRDLYVTGCVSCHGSDGGGVRTPDGEERGPSLKDSGEAEAYYYVATGRMPLTNPDDQPRRKRPGYNDDDILALVAYVGSLGDGPTLPTVDTANADLAEGGVLFRAQCAPCHSASGAGGALSYGGAAPNLSKADELEVAAAARAGPGEMPPFEGLNSQELSDIVRYVAYLQNPDDRGGLPIGRTGPVPEGFVAWFFGIGALLGFVFWIGTRSPVRDARRADHEHIEPGGLGP